MNPLATVYRPALGLLTDLYELTMASAAFKAGVDRREAAFHLYFRRNPFGGGYAVACGLATAVELIEQFRFADEDVAYLSTLAGNDGRPLFDAAFIEHLRGLAIECDLDAIPEGTPVFAGEPLLRVTGPMLQAQILETALLNVVNFQTLVATKAARVVAAAGGRPVIEFGLRRAQGIDGGLSARRAAYVGGCAATSNVLAGRLFGIPVKGTVAHSWVMCFDDERAAFRAFASAQPNNCVLLVDTYDSLEGVRRAVEVGRWLRTQGHELAGVRLDSGDLAALSIQARRILDEAGFPQAAIVASNDLDEHAITDLLGGGALIDVWGVGTRLVTAYDEPARGGVYKLAAVRDRGGRWQPRVKLSEDAQKATTPGVLQVRRLLRGGQVVGDVLFDVECPPRGEWTAVEPHEPARRMVIPADAPFEDLLVPVLRGGRLVQPLPGIEETRRRVQAELARLPEEVKRLERPQAYPVTWDLGLHQRTMEMAHKL